MKKKSLLSGILDAVQLFFPSAFCMYVKKYPSPFLRRNFFILSKEQASTAPSPRPFAAHPPPPPLLPAPPIHSSISMLRR